MTNSELTYSDLLGILEDSIPIICVNRLGELTHVNQVALNWFHCTQEFFKDELIAKIPIENFLDISSEQSEWRPIESVLFKGEVLHLQAKFICEDLKDQKRIFALRDISPQDIQARQLDLLHSISRNLHDGLFRTSEDGHFVYVNESFCSMFGIARIEDIKHLRSIDLYVDPKQRSVFQRLLKVQRTSKNLEILLKRLDGKIFWGLVSVCRSVGENGQIYYDGLIRDITDFKGIERQLKIEKQNAEDASKAKEMFLSTMSHELRTPMNAVIGMTHLLLASSPDPAQEENLKTLRFSAENLLHIINDILDFSKIEAGKVELEKEQLSIRDLLKHIIESFQHKANAKGLELNLKVDDSIKESFNGDSIRLSQILNNLISNAIKFTYHGTVSLAVSVKHESEGEQLIRFEISDTGIGIPESKRQVIFGMFTQANSNTTRKFGGTGLGLTITKKLVELHGSTLHLESDPGHGSRFFFDIPFDIRMKPPLEQKSATSHIQEAGGMLNALKGIKVMVVEDNEVNQILLRKFTQIWGAEMTLAENGLEATQVLSDYDPDIILMDLQMPVMDGYAASKLIRKIPEYKNLPIVAVTASVMLDVQHRIKEAGMNDYVCKPFKPEELLKKIQSLVAKNT